MPEEIINAKPGVDIVVVAPTGTKLSHNYNSAKTRIRVKNTGTYVPPQPNEPPVASFTMAPTGGVEPLKVQFTDTSTGSPVQWSWSIAGLTYTERNPEVILSAGTYVITLSVVNAVGLSDSETKSLTVTAKPVDPPPPNPGGDFILISKADLMALPTTGKAWDAVVAQSNKAASSPSVEDQDDSDNVVVLAKALVAARTANASRRTEVEAALIAVQSSPVGRALALGRELGAYVLAADLIGYRTPAFVSWVSKMQTTPTSGGPSSLRASHEQRPNNWGTWAGASRVISDIYLGDATDLAKAINVWKGWLGDRAAYAGFSYGDLSWQADSSKPVGINLKGATKGGISIDGVLPDDQRRSGGFTTNPPCENYVWEALQGVTLALAVLHRNGTDLWTASDSAVRRALTWLYSIGCSPDGDDTATPWAVNHFTGSSFLTTSPTNPGKGWGYTDWLFGS